LAGQRATSRAKKKDGVREAALHTARLGSRWWDFVSGGRGAALIDDAGNMYLRTE